MVQVDHLVIAVPNAYKFLSSGVPIISRDFDHASALAIALYSHTRFRFPYRLTIIGY